MLAWSEAGTCEDKLAKKWMMDSRRRLKYLIHCCSCLDLSLNQQSLVVREENPLRTFLSCIPFLFFSASICLCLSVSLCLSHSPPLSSSSQLSVVERPFHKKRHNVLFCLLRSWNDAISTSSCCHSCVFVFVQVFQNFFKSLFHFVSGKSHFKYQDKNYLLRDEQQTYLFNNKPKRPCSFQTDAIK